MKSDEVDFLQKYILGCHPDVATEYPILPENVLFVYNNFSPRTPHNTVAFAKSVEDALAPLKLPKARLEDILHHQLFYVNALMARLARCGPFPYGKFAPEHSTPQEKDALAKREARDEKLASTMDPAALLEQSGIEALLSGVTRKVGQYSGGQIIIGKRISALTGFAHSIKLAANRRLQAANLSLSALQKQKQTLQAFEQNCNEQRALIKQSMATLEKDYRNSFVRLFTNRQEAITEASAGRALQLPCPESFMSYADFRRMDAQAKAEFLQPYLQEIARQTIIAVKEQIKQTLDIKEAHIGVMPFKVLKNAREQLSNEMTAFNACINKLKADGLDDLGVHLPEPQAVEELFNAFKLNLDRQIMTSIETAMSASEKEFIDKLTSCVDAVKSNFIVNLFPRLLRREDFWDLMLEKAAAPMVGALLAELISLMRNNQMEGIGHATSQAFAQTADDICTSYIKLSFSLDMAIAQLEKELASRTPMNQELADTIQNIGKGCDRINQQLLAWQKALSQKG